MGYPLIFSGNEIGSVRICPKCNRPTFISGEGQVPGVPYGAALDHVPDKLNTLYNEARTCIAGGSFTSAVLTARKLLMNISVDRGAAEGLSFVDYVDFLVKKGYVPPEGDNWVDEIRKQGNIANHEIVLMGPDEAKRIMRFVEMLLRFIFELPAEMSKP